MRFVPIGILILCFPFVALTQKFENLRAEPNGDKIIITYDITQGYSGDKYTISLYSAHDNFSSALARVTGDVGNGVTDGKGRQIVWDAKSELGNYKGQLSFEVRGEIVAPLSFLTITHSARRGKSLPIMWRGGDKKKDVKIEVLQSGAVISAVGSTSNKGSSEWQIPSKQKTGGDYQVRLTNGRETITTDPFSIKHKIPLLMKVIPLVGVAAVFTLTAGSKSNPTPSTELATPPDLGLN